MRTYKCRLCGESTNSNSLFEIANVPTIVQNLSINKGIALNQKESLFIYQCKCCDLIQLANKPVYYYKTVIRSAGFSDAMKSMRLKQIKKFQISYRLKKDAYVIEIGSGNGEYLNIINRVFPNATGLENRAKKRRKQCSELVIKGFIDSVDYEISNKKYSAFFIFNFLEHIPEPRKFLSGLKNNLKKNSVGIIEVPNFDHMILNGIDYDYTREHLMYFTESTFKKMLTLCGFECIKIQKIWQGHILSAEVRLADGFTLRNPITNSTPAEFIDALVRAGKKIAIWGACHHSFYLVSQIKSCKKIIYFVDSADHKVGKYSPGTGIKILKPEALKKNPPEVLLIIASSYSLEVAKYVKNYFKEITNTYMLADNGFTKI